MDSIFLVDEARANFFQHIVHSFGCTYICLWSYLPQTPNILFFLDGFYREENNQPSSSSGSLSRRLFDKYRQSFIIIENNRVPGLAFRNSRPCMELKEFDLQNLASIQAQSQFYQEARIKTAIFMGCNTGEIELGMSNDTQANLEMEMRNWFPDDFFRQALVRELPLPNHDQTRPSSSSSSLRSLSMDSAECSPLLFNIPSTSYIPETSINIEQAALRLPILSTTTSNSTTTPFQQAIQALSQIRNLQFPTIESEDAAMTKAILAVISSPSSSSSSHQLQQSIPPKYQAIRQKASAFKSYRSALGPSTQLAGRVQRQNMMKRAITFFRSLNLLRSAQDQLQGSRPTSSQLHHMISERKRREKLNESFQALRSLLPPGSKKDKASVLSSTTEYVSSLKAEVAELSRRNQLLEAQVLPPKEANHDQEASNERLDIRVTHIAESTPEERIIDLQVIVRGECSLLDLGIRLLGFLKQVKNVSLMSVKAETTLMVEASTINRVILRLKIEGGEWDESAFQEAVRRVVADLAQ